jgi:hypothetical protein
MFITKLICQLNNYEHKLQTLSSLSSYKNTHIQNMFFLICCLFHYFTVAYWLMWWVLLNEI